MRAKILLMALLLSAGCEDRWRPNTPLDVKAGTPRETYEATIFVLHSHGYQIAENDPAHLYVRARSTLDNDIQGNPYGGGVLRTSYLTFQVLGDGRLSVGVVGFHVRGDYVHVKVDDEREELATEIAELARSGRFRATLTPQAAD